MNFLYVLLTGVRKASAVFGSYREDTDYRLTHNGQVCYLRAVLNDRFDWSQRRIEIEDVAEEEGTILYQRSLSQFLKAPARSTGHALIVNKRAFSGSNSVDFTVIVPSDLHSTFVEAQMQALVDTYKLASKRYTITYR
ncbi:MAG: hypothetical protein IJQ32_03480 [Paludibacteraceae bacterium]|nr:hypothetical protein [Paludibacteraceae bacterium]